MPSPTNRLDNQFPFDGNEQVLPSLRRLVTVLEARLSKAEADQADAADQADELVKVGLARINDVLLPSVERIQKLTSLGFLLAPSSSSVALSVTQKTFTLDEGDQRDLFTPSAYVAIEATGDPDTRAIAHVLAYDAKVGALRVDILAAFGDPAPRTDWLISASPGVTEISRQYWEQAGASATQAAAAVATATLARDAAAVSAAAALASRNGAGDSATAAAAARDAAAASRDAAAASAATVAGMAPKDSPTFTGIPKAPTPALGTNTTQIATMAALAALRSDLVNGAGTALDTLKELADALGNDPNFATTVMNALGQRLRLDAAGGYSDAQRAQGQQNIALAPGVITTGGSFTAADHGRRIRLNGNFARTLPAISGLFTGWSTGRLENVGTSVVTIGAAAGDALEGVGSGTLTLYPKQSAFVFLDADGWHIGWIERTPVVASVLLASGQAVAALDLVVPAGYPKFALEFTGVGGLTSSAVLTWRTGDGAAASLKTGASDYTSQFTTAYNSTNSTGLGVSSYGVLAGQHYGDAQTLTSGSFLFYPGEAGFTRSHRMVGNCYFLDPTPNNVLGTVGSQCNGTSSGAPGRSQILRISPTGGNIYGSFSLRGLA